MGKGSARRPTDWDKWDKNWDIIFKKKQSDKPQTDNPDQPKEQPDERTTSN